jgi:hypothetical protein
MLPRSIVLTPILLCLITACAEDRSSIDAAPGDDAEVAADRPAAPDTGVALADAGLPPVDAGVDAGEISRDAALPDTGSVALDASALPADAGAPLVDGGDPFLPLPDESEA